ncbi:hypothetical protein [Thalassoglobus polymorphus]|uniref:Uncharacterized protein n=1 Tax=Thalassoglobus polymorphus TaxID=2527994 RepID=A0A517QIP0_9PLAN|nr:hypothetical protein [Thalassoglobus polymorphus]QDT31494.1 hypothetical protein Mal48_07280 [Thalassoglobus polymorphus]
MRLTLRTVLAYLDDVLEPAEAREIGQKINESKEASALVSQIREAIRRRRNGAPELAGPGSGPDPNIVSEYLENVLPANQVVEFEQLCRRSEVHLAEVAACHKILTMVMGQPIDVSDELRERMYELGATKKTSSEAPVSVAPQMTTGMGSPPSGGFKEGLPEYLTRGQNTNRIWTVLIVVLMAGAWVALVVSDKSIWTTPESKDQVVQQDSPGPDEVEKEGDAVIPAASAPKAATMVGKQGQPVAQSSPQADGRRGVAGGVSVNPPPPPESEATTSNLQKPNLASSVEMKPANPDLVKSNPVVEVPPQNEIAKASTPGNPPVPNPPAVKNEAEMPATTPGENPNPPEVNVLDEPRLSLVPPERINIIRRKDAMEWFTIQTGAVSPGDDFAAPAPFRGELALGDDLTIQLMEGTRIQRLKRSEEVDLRFAVNRGRVLVSRPPTSLHPTVVEVTVQDRSWKLHFEKPETVFAIEVILPQPTGVPGEHFNYKLKKAVSGGVAVVQGNLKVWWNEKDSLDLVSQHGWLALPKANEPFNLSAPSVIPAWTRSEEQKQTPAKRQSAIAFQKEFLDNVLMSIGPVVSDRRAMISEFATQTLVLTGDLLEVVPALSSDHKETRIAAIIGLRQWLLMDAENVVLLREEMERQMLPSIIDVVIDLLWGFSPEDGQSSEISLQLVEQLGNEDLAIRELAHFQVTQLSGRNYGYHAQAPVPERRAAIGRWLDFLKREGSLVQPE